MKILWRWLFCRRVPVVGERWILDDADPFGRPVVTILDVSDGWVRYTFGLVNSTLPLRRFRAIYVPKEQRAA